MKNRNLKLKTDFLLPKDNFWVGMGSVLNLSGRYFTYNYSKSDNEADFKAILSDWQNVGRDIEKAKKDFEKKENLCLK